MRALRAYALALMIGIVVLVTAFAAVSCHRQAVSDATIERIDQKIEAAYGHYR